MKRLSILFAALVLMVLSACTRIETGEVGVRTDFRKQVVMEELPAGSMNQTIIGDVHTFPVRDLSLHRKINPQAGDNSTLKNFEYTVVYSISAGAAAELWANKSRQFHGREQDGDVLLMWNYVQNIADNSAQKAVRKHRSLVLNDNRAQIEQDIKTFMTEKLVEEKLQNSIIISQVQMNAALAADDIVESANRAIRAENDLKTKMTEVQTAEQEAKRIAMLNSNAKAIEYMNAQSMMTIAEAVKAGKVSTIVIPYDFKGMVNITK